MLYSLIPPILIILSLIGIILFLMKKSSKVAKISIEEIIREEEERRITLQEAGFFQGLRLRIKSIRWESVKHFFLGLMERLTRRSRVVFLKLESKSGSLSAKIRDKRKEREEKKALLRKATGNDDVIQKIREYKPEKRRIISFRRKEEPQTEAAPAPAEIKKEIPVPQPVIIQEEEKEIRPIISDRVVKPRQAEIRDRLEELLIERIAVNPKDVEAYERLGEYYLEIKSYVDSKECFKQVIKLDPANRNAKYKLKKLETLLG